jgi:hypothetical protein
LVFFSQKNDLVTLVAPLAAAAATAAVVNICSRFGFSDGTSPVLPNHYFLSGKKLNHAAEKTT